VGRRVASDPVDKASRNVLRVHIVATSERQRSIKRCAMECDLRVGITLLQVAAVFQLSTV